MKRAGAVLAAVVLLAAGGLAGTGPAEAAKKPAPAFRTCAQLHKVYPRGIARPQARDKVKGKGKPTSGWFVSAQGYRVNARLDRDRDGVACERRAARAVVVGVWA